MRSGALKRSLCLLAALVFLLFAAACGRERPAPPPAESTASSDAPEADTSALADAAAYILRTVPEPTCGSVGGEWAVLGLARSGCGDAAWFETYYDSLTAYV